MQKNTFILLITLSATMLLASCGSLQKDQSSGAADAEEREWVTEEGFAVEGREYSGETGSGTVITADDGTKVLFNDVLFDYDKYSIREDTRPILDTAAYFLNENRGLKVAIEGHTDERGTNEYNLALGERRARAARDYLISLGVSPSRMTIMTLGEEKPICTNKEDSCWQRNRRATFKDSISY
jgi:peptidoglycan-associated lipoprotein